MQENRGPPWASPSAAVEASEQPAALRVEIRVVKASFEVHSRLHIVIVFLIDARYCTELGPGPRHLQSASRLL